MKDNHDLNNINIFGYFFISIGLGGILTALNWVLQKNYDNGFLLFILISGLVYFVTGLALILKQKWGYYLIIFFLKILYIGFPIGTYISKKGLRFLKKDEVKNIFNVE